MRCCSAAHCGALGREVERSQRREEALGEPESVEGVAWLHQGGPGQSGKQEVAVRVPAGVGHARSSPSGVSWKKTRERDGLGQQCWVNTVQAR